MRWAILLSVFIFVGCDKADSPATPVAPTAPPKTSPVTNGWPIIVVDYDHSLRNEASAIKPYFVPAGAGINLQSKDFAFHDPHNLGRTPNTVQVLYEKSVYTCGWGEAASQSIVVDGSTLKPIQGGAFSNFAAGKRAFVAIGFLPANCKSPCDDFTPFWISSVIFH